MDVSNKKPPGLVQRLFFLTSISNKVLSAVTGLFLVAFLVSHLAGNLLLYVGQDAFNAYAYQLEKNKELLIIAEVILLAGALLHIIMGYWLTLQGRAARPVKYYRKKTLGKSNFFSSNMAFGGSLIFIFLIIHIYSFKIEEKPLIVSATTGLMIKDLYTHVISHFASPIYAGFYVLSMIFVGGHVAHGFQSAFRSLGLSNKDIYAPIVKFSYVFGFVIALLFASIPIYFYVMSVVNAP